MLEREGELAQLYSLLDEARAGAGALALVEGPAGIGKTQLLQAAAERAREAGWGGPHRRRRSARA